MSDECLLDGSKEWRGRQNNSQLLIELGCRQDIKAVWIKNGLKDYKTQNFTISIATHPRGPWKQVLNESLPTTTSTEVTKWAFIDLDTRVIFQAHCVGLATQFKLDKAISAKFVRVHISSYVGAGPGIQYLGIESGKGIDMGIRGTQKFQSL